MDKSITEPPAGELGSTGFSPAGIHLTERFIADPAGEKPAGIAVPLVAAAAASYWYIGLEIDRQLSNR